MKYGWRQMIAAAGLAAATVVASSISAQGEPRLKLRVPPFPSADFPNGAAIVLPPEGYQTLEVFLENTLSDVQASTVRVTLNGMPMTPFVALNFMPRGLRAIVKLNVSMSPDYSLRKDSENVLVLEAQDSGRVQYRAQFALSVDPKADAPRLAGLRGPKGGSGVSPPAQHAPPVVTFRTEWAKQTLERTLILDAEVSDQEGLRRIVLEVNGKDVEEVMFQNERPVRKKNGMVARGAMPGEVKGDGRRVAIAIPVKLGDNRVNVVALRVENVLGLSTRADRSVQVGR